MSNNSNYNKISVKTDTTVELLEQLAKLGFFKEKRKSKPKRSASSGDIRQTQDMGPGYARSLLLQTAPGMTPQQIADIQERNNATVAALRAEVEQSRLEDIQQRREQEQLIGSLSTAAARRFGQIGSSVSQLESAVGKITNVETERFRSAQEPGAGVYDPFRSSVILLGDAPPDIKEGGSFTESLNEGAPELEQAQQTELFAEEEGETGITPEALVQSEASILSEQPPPRIEPVKRVFGTSSSMPVGARREETTAQMLERFRNEPGQLRVPEATGSSISGLRNTAAREFGIGPVPDRDASSSEAIRAYYLQLMDAAKEEPDPTLTSKKKLYKGIIDYLDSIVKI
jgi:hypothetical protein